MVARKERLVVVSYMQSENNRNLASNGASNEDLTPESVFGSI